MPAFPPMASSSTHAPVSPGKRRRVEPTAVSGDVDASDDGAADSPEEREKALKRWAVTSAASGASFNVGLRATDGAGLGVCAQRDMKASESVLKLPYSLCVNIEFVSSDSSFKERLDVARQSFLKPADAIDDGDNGEDVKPACSLPDTVQLVLYLIHSLHEPSSPHHDYLLSCPRTFCDTLWWSEEDLALLQGTNLLAKTSRERQRLQRRFRKYVEPLTKLRPELFPPSVFSLQSMRWARSIWSSRAFAGFVAGRGQVSGGSVSAVGSTTGALLPLVDAHNHLRGDSMVEWWLGPAGTALELRLAGDIRAGQELCINYGPMTNEDWLLGYGFCPPDNDVRDALEFSIVCTGPPALLQIKADILRKIGVQRCQMEGEFTPPDATGLGKQQSQARLRVGSFAVCWAEAPTVLDVKGSPPKNVAFPELLPCALAVLQWSPLQAKVKELEKSEVDSGLASAVHGQLLQLLERRLDGMAIISGEQPGDYNHARRSARTYVEGQRRLLQEMAGHWWRGEGAGFVSKVPSEFLGECSRDDVTDVKLLLDDEESQADDGESDSEDESQEDSDDVDDAEDDESEVSQPESVISDTFSNDAGAEVGGQKPDGKFVEYVLIGDGCTIRLMSASA